MRTMPTYTHTYTHTHTHICTYIHTHIRTHTYIHTCIHTQMILERIVMRTMPMPNRESLCVTFVIESEGEVTYDHAKAQGLYKCVRYVYVYVCVCVYV
jgi:hypothetical protein